MRTSGFPGPVDDGPWHDLPGSVLAELELDLLRERVELAEARLEGLRKDTPGSRSAVEQHLASIDALLDLYLEVVRAEQ
jgi:hypothetical protein